MWRSLLLLSLVCACLDISVPASGPGSCGDPGLRFVDGMYLSQGGSGTSTLPYAQPGPKTMVLERWPHNRAVVRITYQREGKTVVETWTDQANATSFPWADSQGPAIAIDVVPNAFHFGDVQLGKSSSKTFRVVNGGVMVRTPKFVIRSEGFVLESTGNSCTAGLGTLGGCEFTVTFQPTKAGHTRGEVTVTAEPAAARTLLLVGQGVAPSDAGAADTGRGDDAADTAPPAD